LRHGMPTTRVRVAAGTLRPAPARAGNIGPPVAELPQVDGAARTPEHEGARHELGRIRVREVLRVWRPLGDGHVSRRLDEAAELRDGHGALIDPEARHLGAADR